MVKSEICVRALYLSFPGIYTYFCLVTGIVLMISFAIKNDSRLYLKQCILFSVGGIVPLVVSSIATFGRRYPDIRNAFEFCGDDCVQWNCHLSAASAGH